VTWQNLAPSDHYQQAHDPYAGEDARCPMTESAVTMNVAVSHREADCKSAKENAQERLHAAGVNVAQIG
jgi:hypothetical protein